MLNSAPQRTNIEELIAVESSERQTADTSLSNRITNLENKKLSSRFVFKEAKYTGSSTTVTWDITHSADEYVLDCHGDSFSPGNYSNAGIWRLSGLTITRTNNTSSRISANLTRPDGAQNNEGYTLCAVIVKWS